MCNGSSLHLISMGKLFQTLVLCRPTYHRPKRTAHGQSWQNILKHLEIGREASKVKSDNNTTLWNIQLQSLQKVWMKYKFKSLPSHILWTHIWWKNQISQVPSKSLVLTVPLLPEQCSVNIPNRNHFEPRSALMD